MGNLVARSLLGEFSVKENYIFGLYFKRQCDLEIRYLLAEYLRSTEVLNVMQELLDSADRIYRILVVRNEGNSKSPTQWLEKKVSNLNNIVCVLESSNKDFVVLGWKISSGKMNPSKETSQNQRVLGGRNNSDNVRNMSFLLLSINEYKVHALEMHALNHLDMKVHGKMLQIECMTLDNFVNQSNSICTSIANYKDKNSFYSNSKIKITLLIDCIKQKNNSRSIKLDNENLEKKAVLLTR